MFIIYRSGVRVRHGPFPRGGWGGGVGGWVGIREFRAREWAAPPLWYRRAVPVGGPCLGRSYRSPRIEFATATEAIDTYARNYFRSRRQGSQTGGKWRDYDAQTVFRSCIPRVCGDPTTAVGILFAASPMPKSTGREFTMRPSIRLVFQWRWCAGVSSSLR